MNHWLIKVEPETYSIEALERDGWTHWDGVRNYQARNFLRDSMKLGDLVLYYYSNVEKPAVVGIARVRREGYPDFTAFDPEDPHYDPKSTPQKPVWFMVDVEFVERLPRPVPLEELKSRPELEGMPLLRRGMRLSVQPVEAAHFELIHRLGRGPARLERGGPIQV